MGPSLSGPSPPWEKGPLLCPVCHQGTQGGPGRGRLQHPRPQEAPGVTASLTDASRGPAVPARRPSQD